MQSNIENDSNSDHVSINVDSLFSKFTSDNPSITGSRSELFVEEEDEEESRNWQTYSNYGGLSICPTVSDADVIEYYNNVSPSFQGLTAEHINSRRCQSPIGPIPEREHNALRISESVGIGIFSGETTNDFRSENEDKCAEIQSAGETTSVSAKRTQAEVRSENHTDATRPAVFSNTLVVTKLLYKIECSIHQFVHFVIFCFTNMSNLSCFGCLSIRDNV